MTQNLTNPCLNAEAIKNKENLGHLALLGGTLEIKRAGVLGDKGQNPL